MDQTLDYVSWDPVARWSRQAVLSAWVGVLSPVLFILTYLFLYLVGSSGVWVLFFLVGVLLLPAAVGVVTGIMAAIRIAASRRRLRGGWLAALGVVLSAGWPAGVVWFAMTNMRIC